MFKLQLTNTNILKAAFNSITHIVDEITLTLDSEGVHLKCLDKSHITFITMDLEKTLFDEYQCDKPEKIAIDCDEFMKVLQKCKSTDTLELTTDENNIQLIFKGDAIRTFKIKFIDMEYDNPTPPEINLPCTIKIPSNLLNDYVNDMNLFDEKLFFTIDENYFIITAEGQKGNGEIKYLHGENIRTVVKSSYSIQKLQDILRASKFTKEATINLGDDMPLIIEFKLPSNDGNLRYLLAPRLETE